MSKNIEKIKGEDVLSEIVNITLDDAKLNGLVSNDVSDMYQSASELKPLKPIDTYESPIVELKANLKLIFRRLFSVPLTILGSNKTNKPISIISMIEQMFNHYRERLKGSEEYGIPSRLDQLTDLPDAPALLADRKIGGVIGAPDGISLAQLLCSTSAASSVTEIVDTNKGWVGRKSLDILTTNLSALKRIQCNAVEWASGVNILQSGVIEEVSLPYLEKINQNGFNLLNIENIELPSVKSILIRIYNGKEGGGNVFSNASKIKHISLPVCESLIVGNYLRSFCRNNSLQETLYMPNCSLVRAEFDGMSINNNPMLHTVVFGILKEFNTSSTQQVLGECPNLVHLEIQGAEASINLRYWSPTTALSERLPEFLSNFKTYIAERLTDKGTGLTLTLSQEVRNAIHAAEDEYGIENIIITKKGWTISPAPN